MLYTPNSLLTTLLYGVYLNAFIYMCREPKVVLCFQNKSQYFQLASWIEHL